MTIKLIKEYFRRFEMLDDIYDEYDKTFRTSLTPDEFLVQIFIQHQRENVGKPLRDCFRFIPKERKYGWLRRKLARELLGIPNYNWEKLCAALAECEVPSDVREYSQAIMPIRCLKNTKVAK